MTENCIQKTVSTNLSFVVDSTQPSIYIALKKVLWGFLFFLLTNSQTSNKEKNAVLLLVLCKHSVTETSQLFNM